MDNGPAPPPSYYSTAEIPQEILRPLATIAQHGYDANDVKVWYLTMLRHLRRMGAQNADAAYNVDTPISDHKAPLPSDADSISIQTSHEDHISPKTMPHDWSREPSYEPSFEPSFEPSYVRQNRMQAGPAIQPVYDATTDESDELDVQLPISSPPQLPLTSAADDASRTILPISNAYIPPHSTPPQFNMDEITTTRAQTMPIPPGASVPDHWFPHNSFSAATSTPPPQQPHYGSAFGPPYHVTMGNASMPMMVPFEPPPPQPHYVAEPTFPGLPPGGMGLSNLANELYTSNYFPMIDVIPSRKRRKQLKSGVRRITQSFPLPRQSV